jgi:uncharacterized membrane protein YfcA
VNLGNSLLLGGAGLLAGGFNAVAGGGSLISFPALLAVGYSSVPANVTNTVALWPGYLGGAIGYRKELAADVPRVVKFGITSVVGSAVGSLLLLTSPASAFTALVPWLILVATAIFAVQPVLAAKVTRRQAEGQDVGSALVYVGVLLSAVYGGYFGAGLGIMLLGVLGTLLPLGLQAINGLKNALSLAINTLAMAAFALVPGADHGAGELARRLPGSAAGSKAPGPGPAHRGHRVRCRGRSQTAVLRLSAED